MAKKNETNAGEDTGTPPTATPTETPKKYYAQMRIIHEDTVIAPGAEVPAGIPKDSLDLLIKQGAVAETPPTPSTVTKGAPPAPPAAAAAPTPAKDGA